MSDAYHSAFAFGNAEAIAERFSPSTVDKTTLVLRGSTSHPAVQRANGLVSASLHRAELAMVEGAAHFVIAYTGTPRGRG